MNKKKTTFDIIIVGGGMVGASMAVALLPLKNIKIGLIDAFSFNSKETLPAYDDRSIALSYGSSLIFQGMGIWQEVKDLTTRIDHIHISDRGHLGAARLHAKKRT